MKILYVEDNPDITNIVTQLLTDNGCEVHSCNSANAALTILDKETVDLVFTDIRLGTGGNGIKLAEQIAIKHPMLPIVLTTGYSSAIPTDGITAWLVIRKPFNVHDLVDVFRNLLANPTPPAAAPPTPASPWASPEPDIAPPPEPAPPMPDWLTRLKQWFAALLD